MNQNSNKYTLIFASVMVIIVASVLSLAHELLKERQNRNIEIDKKSQILRSIGIVTNSSNALEKFNETIIDMFLVDLDGNRTSDTKEDAFNTDLLQEMRRPEEIRRFPVFVASIDGDNKYIMALAGKGLWGDLWGYIAVNSDGNTIFGANFDHASETPGLGAEISHSFFSDQFIGKQIFRDGDFKSVAILKRGQTDSNRDFVDGISGGTITSRGVENMIFDSLKGYSNFLRSIKTRDV